MAPKLDLSSSRYCVEHAKRRIREFELELVAFRDTKPYATVVEPNDDGTEDLHKVKLIKPMPVGLPGIAFDAVSNLRSALDQAGYAAALASGKSGAAGQRIRASFPFRDDPGELDSARTGNSKDIPKEIFDVMISFKPHKGGNILLWALNKLCNTNKHRILVAHVTVIGGMQFGDFAVGAGHNRFFIPRWDSSKNEMVWLRTLKGTHVQGDLKFNGFIAMGDIEGVARLPADAVLNRLGTEITTILDAVEMEAGRIGLS